MNYKVWLPLVAMFIIGGLNAVVPVIPPTFQAVLMAILPAIAGYFHIDAVNKAGNAQ